MVRLNFLTCCCQAKHDAKDKKEAFEILKNFQTGIYTLLIIQLLIDVLWITLSYVNGFALYTIDPSIVVSTGWAHSVSHLGLWFGLEFVAAWLGGQVTSFPYERTTQKSTEGALRFIIVYLIAHGLSMVADIIHIVLTGLEIGDKESTLYVQNFAFLVAYLVVYIIYLVLIKGWLFYRCIVYYRAIEQYTGTSLFFNFLPSTAGAILEEGGAPDLEKQQIRTPIMKTVYRNKK